LSTELDRDAAKGAIISRTDDAPKLDAALVSAHQFQLGLAKEQNRHKEKMRSWFSVVFGSDDSTGAYVAAICALIGLILVCFCLVEARYDATASEFWSKQLERVLAFVTACLAFIFGGSSKQ
jgi:hypothetical protein